MIIILEITIKIIGYSLLLYGIWLLTYPLIEDLILGLVTKAKRKNRLKKYRALASENQKSLQHPLFLNLQLMLHSLHKESKRHAVSNFIILTAILFSVSSVILFIVLRDLILALGLSMLIGLLPYITSRIRLSGLRSRNSAAFLKVFHILLSNYQSTGKDIYFAMVNSIQQISDPALKLVFIKLVNAMQIQKSAYDFNQAVQVFIFSIDNHFAKRFGKLILKAHLAQADIFKSFIQLDADIRKRKLDLEEEMTRNQDTVWQGFFPIVSLPLALFFSYQMSGVLNYWFFFRQKNNLSLFIVCVLLSILSVLLANALKKPKADI